MAKKNIVLTGLMGSGKTAVANELKKLLFAFYLIDTDEEIEKQQGKKINDIFAQDGESHFRWLEYELAQKLLSYQDSIISTGGGFCINEDNIRCLKQNGILFYLKTTPAEAANRLQNDVTRPLLQGEDLKEKLTTLANERESNYSKANFTILTDGKTPQQIAREIIMKYQYEQ